MSDRCHLDVCFCNSWNCCGFTVPLGNALTYEIRFSKPEPTNLKFWVSRFCQFYSPYASVLKTGAMHLYLGEVLWKWINPKYVCSSADCHRKEHLEMTKWDILQHTASNAHSYTPSCKNRTKCWLCALSRGSVHIVHWIKQSPCGRNNIWPWMCYYQIITLPYPLLPNKG